MIDVSGREIGNRSIALFNVDNYGLQFGVVDSINEDCILINTIIVFQGGHEEVIGVEHAETNTFLVSHRQLPGGIKNQLIRLSEERINGPGDLRDITL